jgi:hypothetical protein
MYRAPGKWAARALAGVVALAAVTTGGAAAAVTDDPTLAPEENARLMRGDVIVRPETITRDERRYVGGVTYSLVGTTGGDLDTVLLDPRTYTQILPRTKAARIVGRDGGDVLVELRQGTWLMEGTYTIVVRPVPGSLREVRFWLDPRRPHDIEDAWGFFRIEPLAQVEPGKARSLLTYGVLVDLGPGLVRDLFEERIRALALSVPSRVRDYVARAHAPRASP